MTHSHLVPTPPAQTYVPRVFGYKIHKTSEYYTGRKKLVGSSRDREKYRKAMTLMDRYKASGGGQVQER
jgi:casein kinase II subunit beta